MVNNNYSFELKLVVIAILIPVFLQIFPEIIKGVIYPPFTFLLPYISSIFLGLLWFVVLMLGLSNLTTKINKKQIGKEYLFGVVFDFAVYFTSLYLIIIVFAYIVATLMLLFDLKVALAIVYLILFIIYLLNKWRKNKNGKKKDKK